jgi:membrane dipeptidase
VPRTPQVGLEKHLDQYVYLKKLIGVDHIGLGPDFVDGPGRNDPGIPDPNRMPPEIYSQQPWFYVKGFENISELPNVTRGLIQRGWSTGEIRKVLGENWLRVYEKVWGGAAS